MKRLMILLMILSLSLSAAGCAQPKENTCSFYYLRTEETIRHGYTDGLIAPVTRVLSTPDAQLDYLLQLYLDGPTEENFLSPIPKGTYLLKTLWDGETLILVLSREFSTLDNISLTLAGMCLCATCEGLTGAEHIQIRSGDMTYDFNLNQFTFLDASTGQ